MNTLLAVRHNIEVAHRILGVAGKCNSIHGHSMWVTMEMECLLRDGMAVSPVNGEVVDFGSVKKVFRSFLDEEFDHALLLAEFDPMVDFFRDNFPEQKLAVMDGHPSTEFIAHNVLRRMLHEPWAVVRVHVDETHVNSAGAWKEM